MSMKKTRKILLTAVNAKYIHSNPAIYSLRAYAKKYRDYVDIAEFTINHYVDDILQGIYRKQPDVVAFSCYIWNLDMVEQVIRELPKILPEVEIWVGGPEVSYDAKQFLQTHPQVTGVMIGEGEETFCELAGRYVRGWEGTLIETDEARRMDILPGTAQRQADGSIAFGAVRPVMDMNAIPFLYEDLSEFENRIIYYESSRGCPFSCSYCLSSIDKRVRFRDTGTVQKELQFFLDRKVPQVKFVDRTFNCRHSHSMAIWNYILEHDNGITNFHFEIAADLLNEEELVLLRKMRPGLVQLEIGVQSTNEATIHEIDRVMDFEHLSQVVRRIQEGKNIHQHLDLIAGLPEENLDSFKKSFNDVYGLYPDQLQLGFLKVLKGSKMHKNAEHYGIVYHSGPVYEVLGTKWISYGDLLLLKAVEEMVEVYYNSGQFAYTLRYLEKEFAHPFAMFEAMAQYYEEMQFSGKNHSRMGRFDILREFIYSIREKKGSLAEGRSVAFYEELLLLDLYLRENSKSRPKWATDLTAKKSEILDFYKEEEETHQFLKGYEGYNAKQMMHMCHVEYFSYDVLGNGEEKQCRILFDYQHRSPLNHDARFCYV